MPTKKPSPFTRGVVGALRIAWARYWLQRAIDLCGDNFVYCDTDSVKYLGDVDLTELNEEIRAASEKHGAYADDRAGVRHYLGVFEDENYEPGTRFCTMGAKKYAYEDSKGLHITIAGVSKSGAAEMGSIENFREGFIFHESAGAEATYNDDPHGSIKVDGHEIELTPNIYLEQSMYKLGQTADYKWLFHVTQEQFDKFIKTR